MPTNFLHDFAMLNNFRKPLFKFRQILPLYTNFLTFKISLSKYISNVLLFVLTKPPSFGKGYKPFNFRQLQFYLSLLVVDILITIGKP